MRVSRLETLVRADVVEQFAAYGRGELDGMYDGETWAEYVDGIAYWEFGGRGEMTSEYIMWDLCDIPLGHRFPRRLIARLRDVWFAEARSYIAPLSFDGLVKS